MTEFHNVWIRIAGNSKRIKKALKPPHWRFQIDGSSPQHLLMGWTLYGIATKRNNRQETNSAARGIEMIAWVEYFGDVTVDDNDHAHITLKEPPVSQDDK